MICGIYGEENRGCYCRRRRHGAGGGLLSFEVGITAQVSDSHLQRIQNPGRGPGAGETRRSSRQWAELYATDEECQTRSANAAAERSEVLEGSVPRAVRLGHDGQGQRGECVRDCAVRQERVVPAPHQAFVTFSFARDAQNKPLTYRKNRLNQKSHKTRDLDWMTGPFNCQISLALHTAPAKTRDTAARNAS